MIDLIDKIVIFIFCLAFPAIDKGYDIDIMPVIIAITLSSLNSYFEKKSLKLLFFAGYTLLCIFRREYLVFLPLICYDMLAGKEQLLCLFALIPAVMHFGAHPDSILIMLILIFGISYLLKYRTVKYNVMKESFTQFRDTTKERSILMEKKNSELLEKQDYEINVATLNERNRIAMEIHDNVGHLLSRCLLQIGAIMAINKNDILKENLASVKKTLSQAMDSIRNSVHNLHDESIDLYSQINSLVENFSFCPIQLDYDIGNAIEKKLKFCFIAIVKEALSNIIKHSAATEVSVALREHPALYQLIIRDNGKVASYNMENGIGLNNISDRVRTFNGNFHVNIENGFKIFISIPKY